MLIALCTLVMHGATPTPKPRPNPWSDNYEHFASADDSPHWGTYNVHDPACRKVGDYFYMYSTDAIYFGKKQREEWHAQLQEAKRKGVAPKPPKQKGYLQMRRSKDLVNWEFMGWAFADIPQEPVQWVKDNNGGEGATNIWAPYMVEAPDGNGYRLYYCVSAFGKSVSMISMATAPTPLGPWTHQGCVVRTDSTSVMNAIDPTVSDVVDGRQWMIYGSYFGGIYCLELDPATGMPCQDGDLGHLVARRANYKIDNLEAPELIYVPEQRKYYLFGSYDPLVTSYNVRVGRSDMPQGPFYDYNGALMADTTNNLPILTAPYQFEQHPGWGGVAHCGVFNDGHGNWYMCHQGRLAPELEMLNLHVRQLWFTPDGWPVVSPERYAGNTPQQFDADDLVGTWEILRLHEPEVARVTAAGQVLAGENQMLAEEWNHSTRMTLNNGGVLDQNNGKWTFDTEKQQLTIQDTTEIIKNLIIFAGHDWERQQDTVLFTGLDSQGRTIWGKKIAIE